MKYRLIFALTACILFGEMAYAQPADTSAAYTLPRCMALALENNVQVRQAGWTAESGRVNATSALGNMLPYVTGTVNHGLNQGRGLDPTTNTYIDQQITFANYNLNGSLTLWNGFSLLNGLQQSRLSWEAGKMDLQQMRENVMISVVLAYLQVLSSDEQVAQARQQVAVSARQVERLQTLDSQGAVAPALLYDLRGQLANDRLNEVNARNSANTARLTLAQLLNIPFSPTMRLEALPEGGAMAVADANGVFQNAYATLPQIKAADMRVRSAQKGLLSARGQYWPSIYAFGNLGTTYSSAAQRTNTSGGTEEIPYGTQWRNNRYSSMGIGIQVPIITAFQTRTKVGLAKIARQQAEFQAKTARNLVQQNVETALLNQKNAMERYQALQQQVDDFTKSFQAAEARFEAGVSTAVDYMVAKNNLDRARSNRIAARYDLALRGKVVDYYQGKSLQ